MIIVYIGLASVVFSLLLLWAMDKFVSNRPSKPDVEAALRQLLLAKAEGTIDQAEYEQQQAALHALILQPAPTAQPRLKPLYLRGAVVSLVLVVAAGAYWAISSGDKQKTPEIADMSGMPGADKAQQANSGGDLNTVVKRLADKMAKDPGNGEGWLLLAKTYGELRKYAEEADAYAKAAAILPPEAGMLADWADSYVMSKGGTWDESAQKIVQRALAADPKHVKTLALAGSEAFGRKDFKAAIAFWKRMKAVAPADSMDQKLADANIAEAVAVMSGKKPTDAPSAPEVAAAPGVSGVVTLSAKLKAKVSAEDTVFVFAKAPGEGGPPLAVKRYKGSDFPIKFELDDSAAIIPGRSVSKFSEIQVSAKVSKSGDASPQKGDVFGAPQSVKLGTSNIKLELDTER